MTFGRLCTFGFPGPDFAPGRPGIPGFNGPYWGNLITGAVYVAAALYVAMTKRF